MNPNYPSPIVVLVNGRFPSHPQPLEILENAGTIICTDGSADRLLVHNRSPHIIIGDMDSTKLQQKEFNGLWVENFDQDRTDLQKTLDWCIGQGMSEITILGAMADREDHSLGNLHALAEFSDRLIIHFVTDNSLIYCVSGQHTFPSEKDQLISIVAIAAVRSITTLGLKYPLTKEPFPPACNGISNLTLGTEFTIKTSDPIWLFLNHTN